LIINLESLAFLRGFNSETLGVNDKCVNGNIGITCEDLIIRSAVGSSSADYVLSLTGLVRYGKEMKPSYALSMGSIPIIYYNSAIYIYLSRFIFICSICIQCKGIEIPAGNAFSPFLF